MRNRVAWWFAGCALVVGCGVPSGGDAQTLGTPPFGLAASSTAPAAPTTVPPEEGFRLTLYWVSADNEIVPSEPIGLPEAPTFQAVLDLLTVGPPLAEGTNGTTTTSSSDSTDTTTPPPLLTFITEGLNPEGEDVEAGAVGPVVGRVDGGTVDVLIADRFREESVQTPARFRLGIAQVVCTLTQFPNADAVRFFDSRGQVPLVSLDSSIIEVATRENIGQCDPPPAPVETTTTAARRTTTSDPAGRDTPGE